MHNVIMGLDWSKYPNFKKDNFQDGGPEMHPDFMRKLQSARAYANIICYIEDYPEQLAYFVINSGSRSETKNRQVGGKPDSTHLHGRACDIKAANSRSRYVIVKSLLLAGFTRIGIGEDFIHVDDGDLITDRIGHPKDPDVLWLY